MKNIWILILIFILTGCNKYPENKTDILIDDFPKNISLSPFELSVPNILLNPVRMFTVDSFLLIFQDRDESMVNIFSLPDCQYICSFGRKGKGPGELFLSFNGTFKPIYGNNSGFTLGNKMININYYRVTDIINNNFKPYKIASLPPKLNRFLATVNIGDSVIFGSPYGGNMEMFKYNNNTQTLECFREYPDELPFMNDEAKTNLYAYYLASKPDNKKFVRVYEVQGKLEIFDLATNENLIISYKNFPSLKENCKLEKSMRNLPFNEDQIIFCWGVQATNKYIYARIYNDKYKNIVDGDELSRDFIPEIHVFDWFGNPVATLKFSEYYDFFAIDLNDKYLYTCDSYTPNIIKRYELNQVF